jgi:hypothetical protein
MVDAGIFFANNPINSVFKFFFQSNSLHNYSINDQRQCNFIF